MDDKVKQALEFIRESLKKHKHIAVMNSFGKDSIVVQHLVNRVFTGLPVIWLNPPFLPEETVKYATQIIKDWKLKVHVAEAKQVHNKKWLDTIVYTPELWKSNPELCCQIFKVQPSKDMIAKLKLDAWFSGMRKTESEKRGMYTQTWKQDPFTKLHPIIDFTEADVWRYIAVNKIPVNPLYKEGYRSLGCNPCSHPNIWSSERGGRWMKTMMEGGDCGIHCTPMK